jgi:hypothetical protein
MKQRRQSYLMNNDQRGTSNRGNYIPSNFNTRPPNSYDIIQDPQQKIRLILSYKNKSK